MDGVRQVGKTTGIQLVLEDLKIPHLEINLEKAKNVRLALDQTLDFMEFERLLKQEYGFVPGDGQLLFIDEANESHRLGHYVRQMKEDWQDQTVILTGSMMLRLFRDKDVRIPVGRYETLTVGPFSFDEFLLANESTHSSLQKFALREALAGDLKKLTEREHSLCLSLLNHYLICGGIPAITLAYLESSAQLRLAPVMLNYLESLREDFLKIFSVEYANLFDRALVSVANLLGQPYKKSALIQGNYKLADNLLAIFENWKLVHKIEQRSSDPTRANSLHPKRYLFDVGVARLKREAGFPTVDTVGTLGAAQREPLGGLIEQLAVSELKPLWPDLCGFRDRSYEIDFILKSGSETIPVECKASLKVNSNQYKGLDLYQKRYGNKRAFVISLAPFQVVKRSSYEIIHLPVYALGALPGLVMS